MSFSNVWWFAREAEKDRARRLAIFFYWNDEEGKKCLALENVKTYENISLAGMKKNEMTKRQKM